MALTLLLLLMIAQSVIAPSKGCDPSVWGHVYNPQRLTIKERCVAVTGVIVDATHGKRKDGVRKEADGDTHGWLKLDTPFASMINDGNRTNEGGNLVFEIVCYWKPTQRDAVKSCPANYHNAVVLPPVGSHVRIIGTFVQDDNHAKWLEIHPVSSIHVLR